MKSFTLLYLLSEAFALYCLFVFYKAFLPLKITDKVSASIVFVFSFLMYSLPNLLFHNKGINLILGILTFAFFTLLFDGKIYYKILLVFFGVILSLESERLIAVISEAIHVNPTINPDLYGIGCMVISRLLFYMIIKSIDSVYRKKTKYYIDTYQWWAVLTIPILSIVIIYKMYLTANDTITYVWILILLFAMNIIVLYLYENLLAKYRETLEIERLKLKNDLYANHILLMSDNQKTLQKWKHNMISYLSGVISALKVGKTDNAISLLQAATGKLASNIIINSGNVSIDTIMSYMIQKITENGIKVNREISVPKDFEIDYGDFAIVLGNSVDNAIEACQRLDDDKDKKIDISLKLKGDLLIYSIKNKYNTIKTVRGWPVSTKQSGEHGFGLTSIKSIAHKNKGKINIKTENGIFELQVDIWVTQ